MTGNSMDQLKRLKKYTVKPHFEINGLFVLNNQWRQEVFEILKANHKEVFLSLEYYWGSLTIGWERREADVFKQGINFMMVPKPEWELSNEWQYISNMKASLLHVFNFKAKVKDGQILSDNTRIVINIGNLLEQLEIHFNENYFERATTFLVKFLQKLDKPDAIHAIINSDFNTIQHLKDSGKIKPCGKCFDWHLGYSCIGSKCTNINLDNLLELAQFVSDESSRERSISFSGFTWKWEDEIDPKVVNKFVWELRSRNIAIIKMDWYAPLPRGMIKQIRDDAKSYLATKAESDRAVQL